MAESTIQPVYGRNEETFDERIEKRKDMLSVRRETMYGRLRRALLFSRKIDFVGLEPFNVAFPTVLVAIISAIAAVGVGLALQNWYYVCWSMIGAIPFMLTHAARAATFDHGKTTHPAWFKDLLRKRAGRHETLRREIAAFDTWAGSAEMHPEYAENLAAQAEERRKQLRAAVEDELRILDRAVRHRERVKRLVEARSTVDAAFPEPTGRMTTDLASRLSLLHTVEALSEEAVELGMPTDEIRFLRRDRE